MAFNDKTNKLEIMLGQLAQSMGLSVREYVQGGFVDVTSYGVDKASIISRLDAIDVVDSGDSVETLAEKIIAINEVLGNDQGELQGILDLITANGTAIQNLTDVAAVRYTSLLQGQSVQDTRLTDNANAILVNTAAIDALQAATGTDLSILQDRVSVAEVMLATLRGDSSVVGSVSNSVLAEENRAKAVSGLLANLNTSDKTTLVAAINEVRNHTLLNSANINELQNLSDLGQAGLQQEIIDRANADTALGNSIMNLQVLITDLTSALAVETQARIDGDINNETSIATEIVRATNAEQGLQDAIDALGGNGSGSLGDLEARVTANENDINDTTDGNDNLVKGLKTKVSDNAAAIAALGSQNTVDIENLRLEVINHSDSNDIHADTVDVCAIGNIFRTALGLGTQTCDGGGGDGDGAVL